MENGSNIGQHPPLAALLERRLSRRGFLGLVGVMGASVAAPRLALGSIRPPSSPLPAPAALSFEEIPHQLSASHVIASGYQVTPLIHWGDPLVAGAAPFDPEELTPAAQRQRFGYNNDFLAYLPLRAGEAALPDHGLLCVNHEYTVHALMFNGAGAQEPPPPPTEAQARIEMEAQGCSIIEIRRSPQGHWRYLPASPLNRRITANTPMRFSGVGAGHPALRTASDMDGMNPLGTLANCAGGVTPWGTVLTAEENIDHYFGSSGTLTPPAATQAMYARYGIGTKDSYQWRVADARFDLSAEPNEPNRFGWIVEYDPYDPTSVPVKRTSLGRFKHESATTVMNYDGRIVVYSGDDEAFEYLYRFVSEGIYDSANPLSGRDLLDRGTLSVARFAQDGTLEWLPLRYGEGKLTSQYGIHSQADIAVYTRHAADLVGATPMDRPEDVEVSPETGSIFVSLTKNPARLSTDAANPRAVNVLGHILELQPPPATQGTDGVCDHTARHYQWDVFLQGGDPKQPSHHALYQSEVSAHGWLANPDNLASDGLGRLWICTDGQQQSIGAADGLYATHSYGARKGATRQFFAAPVGAEVTGPAFTPDATTLFVSVQHPGLGSTREKPSTRWPDFRDDLPPRPTVIAITKKDGGVIGS